MKKSFVLIAFTLLILVACGQDVDEAPLPLEAEIATEVRDSRYCEFLVVKRERTQIEVTVYPTFGVNDCPVELWNAMDAEALKESLDALVVSLNGPRFFVMDGLTSFIPGGDIVNIGGMDVRLAATIEMSIADLSSDGEDGGEDGSESAPYTVAPVQRNTEYVFNKGSLVYELISPEGDVYVMQSYSHIVDDSLTIDSLSTLADRISPPAGWAYRVRELDEELVMLSDGLAHVVQDELSNSYQQVTQ